ncbi:MAG: TRAP transporter large permease [Pseudomonadota bacterium]
MLSIVVIAVLIALLLIGIPVAFAMGIAGVVGLYFFGGPDFVIGFLETTPYAAVNSYELLTIPMFLLMAEFIIISGIADDLFEAMSVWVGRVRAGLGISTALAGAGFGAISGSSTASAATLAGTSVPAMLRQGYDPRVATGVVAITGGLAMLIPPSVPIVLYGLIAEQSIGRLLVAGIVPGLLVMLTIIATIVVISFVAPAAAPRGQARSWADKLAVLPVVGPIAVLVMLVTGIIYLGVATPTEAASIGATGAMVIAFLKRRLTWRTAYQALVRAGGTTAMIIMIIVGAHIFGYFFTLTQVTQNLVSAIGDLEMSRWTIIVLVLLVYLVLGFFMDQIAILFLTVPVTLPVIVGLGFDPIWFGIIVIITAEIGMVTPPLGLNVFVVSQFTKQPLERIFAGVAPHVAAHIGILAVLVAFPILTLWLPSTMGN